MAGKISKQLTMAERFVLLNNLPKEGDLVTFKILRKLRETLAPTEKEIKEYSFKNSYRCPHKEYNEKGRAFQCEVEEEAAEAPPKCHIHDVFMRPAGKVSWNPEKWDIKKEIWFGQKANSIIADALKKISEEDKQVNDDIVANLCDKFIGNEEEDEKE